MTGQELIDEIRECVDEPGPKTGEDAYYTDTRILSRINESYQDIVNKSGCLFRKTNFMDSAGARQNECASASGEERHYLPSDFQVVHWKWGVWWVSGSSSWQLEPVSELELERNRHSWIGYQNSGTPKVYTLEQMNLDEYDDTGTSSGNIIRIFPYPSSDGYNLRCYYVPTMTELTLETSPKFRKDYHWALVYDVAAKLKDKREKFDAAKKYGYRAATMIRDMRSYYAGKQGEKRRQIPLSRGKGRQPSNVNIIVHP